MIFRTRPVITVLHHDSENEIEVDCEAYRCHKRLITYQAELEQLVLVIDNSEECQQYFKVKIFFLLSNSVVKYGW